MNFGRTLMGAVVGAAVAIGIYLGLRLALEYQATWFPVVTGLLVGLGVRQANKSLPGSISYLRGAFSGLAAIAAILGGELIAQKIYTARSMQDSKPAPSAVAASDTDADEEAEESDSDPAAGTAVAEPESLSGVRTPSTGAITRPEQLDMGDTWPFVFMAVGVFLAYEFARGTAAPGAATADPDQEAPSDDEAANDAEPEEQRAGDA